MLIESVGQCTMPFALPKKMGVLTGDVRGKEWVIFPFFGCLDCSTLLNPQYKQKNMNAPNGYAAINEVFGNPANPGGSLNHAWYHASIVMAAPPSGWQLYYQASETSLTPIKGISIHHLLQDSFTQSLQSIWAYAVQQIGGSPGDDAVRDWLHNLRLDITGGGFNFRPNTSNSAVLSMHSYGIAIDWDPSHNPRQKPLTKTLPDWWYAIWNQNGWTDGRHFSTPDPMHIQFATGA
jgi:hypothetical protein